MVTEVYFVESFPKLLRPMSCNNNNTGRYAQRREVYFGSIFFWIFMAIHIAIFCFVLRPMSEFEVLMTARSLGGATLG